MKRAMHIALVALTACASGRTRAPLPAPAPVDNAPLRSDRPPIAELAPWSAPEVETWTLANGMAVWFVRVPSSTASVAYCNTRAGEDDVQTQAGLPSLTASLLLEGTRTHRGRRHAQALGAHSASAFATANRDGTCVHVTMPNDELDAVTALLSEAIREPRFDIPDFAAARTAQMDERVADVLSPSLVARQMASFLVFGDTHVYGRPLTGLGPEIRARTVDQVRAYHRDRYHPAVSALLVAGPDRERAQRAIDQSFSTWNVPAPPPIDAGSLGEAQPPRAERLHVIDTGEREQSHVLATWPAPAPWGEDAAALSVLGLVMGGMFGSRLNFAFRESAGYAYSAQLSGQYNREGGLVFASANVEAARTDRAVFRLLDEVYRLRTRAVGERELRSAIALERAALRDSFSRSASATRHIASIYLARRPPSTLATIDAAIRSVTAAAVRAAAERYFSDRNAIVIVAGPRATIEPGLRQLELAARGMEFWNFQR